MHVGIEDRTPVPSAALSAEPVSEAFAEQGVSSKAGSAQPPSAPSAPPIYHAHTVDTGVADDAETWVDAGTGVLTQLRVEVHRRVRVRGDWFPAWHWWEATIDVAPIGIDRAGRPVFNLKFVAALGVEESTEAVSFAGPCELLRGDDTHYRFKRAGGQWWNEAGLYKFLEVAVPQLRDERARAAARQYLRRKEPQWWQFWKWL